MEEFEEPFTGIDPPADWPELPEGPVAASALPTWAGLGLSLLTHLGLVSAIWLTVDISPVPTAKASGSMNVTLNTLNAEMSVDSDSIIESSTTADVPIELIEPIEPIEIEQPPEVQPAPEPPRPEPVANMEQLQIADVPPAVEPPTKALSESLAAAAEPVQVATPLPIISSINPQATIPVPIFEPEPELKPIQPEVENVLLEKVKAWQEELLTGESDFEPTSFTVDNQQFTVEFEQLPATDASDLEKLRVVVSTERDGAELVTEMELKRLAFSHFGQVINRWDRDVRVANDTIEGRFHSNTRIDIASDRNSQPEFLGKVTVASSAPSLKRSSLFKGGLETRVKPILFPDRIEFDTSASNAHVRYFPETTQITFFADGSYAWRQEDSDQWVKETVPPGVFYLMGAEDKRLMVQGVVDGQVVVYSPERISITGDLRYADDPENNPLADDFLSLVSDKYVEIAGPSVTGRGDISVYAAIYAKRRFLVRRFSTRSESLLTIYGSVTAGTLSATEPRFSTVLRFDSRFEDRRPANFPMTNKYELDSWDGQWRVQPQ